MSKDNGQAEQDRLDLEDAQARLAALDRAIAAYDLAREELAWARANLKRSQRRATEARWDVERLMADQRRRAAAPPPKEGKA